MPKSKKDAGPSIIESDIISENLKADLLEWPANMNNPSKKTQKNKQNNRKKKK